jgi:AraC family transcriptional regulator of adaptative response / DNA-3-methyladenine glycosylase II
MERTEQAGHTAILDRDMRGRMDRTQHPERTDTFDDDVRYDALRARDRRFDGTFFVGVRTTGVYCRPVCRARLPHRRNCTFFDSAAEAEANGYRPCLRCRPELAPGRSLVDAASRLATAAHARITSGGLNGTAVRDIARELCVGERQLRRAVRAEFGVSPIELAQTQRLLIAKQLLTDTNLPIARVAFASGFSSLSRFNTLFLSRYRLSPSRLRREGRGRTARGGGITLLFGYRPPFDWARLLAFLRSRAIPGIDTADATSYTRTIRIGEHAGWFRVRQADIARALLAVDVSDSLVPVLMPLRAGVRRLLDLDADPALVAAHFAGDAVLDPLVARWPGLRLPGSVDGFEIAVRAVLGQQVSVAAARTLNGRLHAKFGEPIRAVAGLDRLPVAAETLAAARPTTLSEIGIPQTRARTLVALAQSVAAGDISFEPTTDVPGAVAALQRIRGVGAWTGEYIAMRAFHWPDAFPATDLGVRRALRGADPVRASERWRPWRAYAVLYLWTSLEPNRSE